MKCPKCLLGDISLTTTDKQFLVNCSHRCYKDMTISIDYEVGKILFHNHLLEQAEFGGAHNFLIGEEKENPYSDETEHAYHEAWEHGYLEEQSNRNSFASSFAQKKETEEKIPEDKIIRKKYNDARFFLDILACCNHWFGRAYKYKITQWIRRNPF